jgi:hypothetical protein
MTIIVPPSPLNQFRLIFSSDKTVALLLIAAIRCTLLSERLRSLEALLLYFNQLRTEPSR